MAHVGRRVQAVDRVKILKHIDERLRHEEMNNPSMAELALKKIKHHLDRLSRSFTSLSWFGNFLMFGYYLAIPIVAAISALCCVFSPEAVVLARKLFGGVDALQM